jgi:hypothetical protein
MTRDELILLRATLMEQLDAANTAYLEALAQPTLQFALVTRSGSQKVLRRELKSFEFAISSLEKRIAMIDAKLSPSGVWGITTRRQSRLDPTF